MTTRYKTERAAGKSKHDAVCTALSTSISSIIVSGMGLFAATFGVAIYSDIDIISSMCMLMARGAIVSMLLRDLHTAGTAYALRRTDPPHHARHEAPNCEGGKLTMKINAKRIMAC